MFNKILMSDFNVNKTFYIYNDKILLFCFKVLSSKRTCNVFELIPIHVYNY